MSLNIIENTAQAEVVQTLPKAFEAAIVTSARYFARGLVKPDMLKNAVVALRDARCATLAAAGVLQEHMQFDAIVSFLIEAPTLADDLALAGLRMDGVGSQRWAVRNLIKRFGEEYPYAMGESLDATGQSTGRQVLMHAAAPEKAIEARFMHEVALKAFANTTALIAALTEEVERQPAQMTFTRQAPALFPPLLATLFQMARIEPRKVHYDRALLVSQGKALIEQSERTLHPDSLVPMLSKILVPENQNALLAQATEIRNIAILRRWVHATR